MSSTCPSDNTQSVEQGSFWSSNGGHLDAHKAGWIISGACATVAVLLSMITVLKHARNYHNPAEQRQILRILYMPPIYSVISFFSYRFFRSYTYYDLIETIYESITLSAFLLLLIQYVASTTARGDVYDAIARKDKKTLPIPFCCWRYRPTKAYFMYTVKWSVLQYVIIRPILSIVGIIAQKKGVLCVGGSWSFHTANAYITIIDGISITIALYGLILFYGLTKEELKGRRPLAKFLSIKLIVMLTFYQSLVFTALEGRVIHATQFWTETNIADGLNALCICIEMVLFSAFMMWSYTWAEYKTDKLPPTSIGRPLLDSINYMDFLTEIWTSVLFFRDYILHRPHTRGNRQTVTDHESKARTKVNFGEAFGVEGSQRPTVVVDSNSESSSPRARVSRLREDSEDIRLAPYTYGNHDSLGQTRYAGSASVVPSAVASQEDVEGFRGQYPPAAVVHGQPV